jgi:hypothetical protein
MKKKRNKNKIDLIIDDKLKQLKKMIQISRARSKVERRLLLLCSIEHWRHRRIKDEIGGQRKTEREREECGRMIMVRHVPRQALGDPPDQFQVWPATRGRQGSATTVLWPPEGQMKKPMLLLHAESLA